MFIAIYVLLPLESIPKSSQKDEDYEWSGLFLSFSKVAGEFEDPAMLFQTTFQAGNSQAFARLAPDALISFASMLMRAGLNPKAILPSAKLAVDSGGDWSGFFDLLDLKDHPLAVNHENLVTRAAFVFAEIEHAILKRGEVCAA